MTLFVAKKDRLIINNSFMRNIFLTLLAFSYFNSCNILSRNKISSWQSQLANGENIVISNKGFSEDINFPDFLKSIILSAEVKECQIRSSIVFKNCIFYSELNAFLRNNNSTFITYFDGNIVFEKCIFKGDVNFRGSVFNRSVIFSDCLFEKLTSFESCTFRHSLNMTKNRFEGETRFQNCFFGNKANFMGTIFTGITSFQQSLFIWDAQFSAVQFYGYADFSLCSFSQTTLFNYCEFKDQLIFDNCDFRSRCEFNYAIFKGASFRYCYFGQLSSFQDVKAESEIDFSDSFFVFQSPSLGNSPKEKFRLLKH